MSKPIHFTDGQVLAIAKTVMETKCGYCMDGADLDEAVCPECGAKNLFPDAMLAEREKSHNISTGG